MREKELLGKIRELRRIQPRKDWVVLTKKNLLGEEMIYRGGAAGSSFLEIFRLKLIFVPVLAIFVLIGIFGFAQHSLPGDLLYSIKKATEKGQAVFVSEAEEPNFQLELANKRLEELKTIAEKNEVTKLPPAIKEVQNSASKAAKNLVKSKKVDQKTVENVLKFEKTKEEIENNILATQLGIKEEENPTKIYVEYLIEDLEKRTLTEEDEEILNQTKELVEEGKYAEALIKLYLINQKLYLINQ